MDLHRRRLFKLCIRSEVRRNKGCTLMLVLLTNVPTDCPTLIHDQTIIVLPIAFVSGSRKRLCTYDVGNLAKWLLGDVRCRLVLLVDHVDFDCLERNLLFKQDHRDSFGIGGPATSKELQDHVVKSKRQTTVVSSRLKEGFDPLSDLQRGTIAAADSLCSCRFGPCLAIWLLTIKPVPSARDESLSSRAETVTTNVLG